MNEQENFKPVTHCIFDMDGLLVDSERRYQQAVQKILEPFGHKYTYDIQQRTMGRYGSESAEIIINAYNLPYSREEFLKLYLQYCREYLQNVPLMPGVDRLVRHLHGYHVPLAIATSSKMASFQLKAAAHAEFFKLFHHVVAGGTDPEVKRSKPAPDVFLIAAARFVDKPDPNSCLAFEDSPNGMRAALNAGMQVVLIPDPEMSADAGKAATLSLSSMEQFQPQVFGLPSL